VKLTLVHDWLNQMGGAEDVLLELARMYPDSPILTSIYAPDALPDAFRELNIRTLWMDRLPGIHAHHQRYLPLYPLAWGRAFDRDAELLLSNKSGFCHGVRGGAQTVHVCYCLAPTRYVWQFEHYVAREGLGRGLVALLRPLVALLKRWDYAAAQRVTEFVAISTEVQTRIRDYYQRDSVVIYPPVETERFAAARTDSVEDYFLVVSRLIPYKRIDLAVKACTALGLPLKIAGRGRDLERLKAMAGPTVEFLGYVPDDELPTLMARCKAFLFPGLEDFGIAPVQAQAAGRPVIAYAGGGAMDTVIPGVSGERFTEQTVEALSQILTAFDGSRFDADVLQAHARQFDVSVFRRQLVQFLDQCRETRNRTAL
jgi:glycosyltransferase involved in cell wall biosynthesis